MNDIERIIGKLQAHHEDAQRRFDDLEKKVDALWIFRWKIAGMVTVASTIAGGVIAAIVEWVKG